MQHTLSLAVAAVSSVFPLVNAVGQVGESGYSPPQAATSASQTTANAAAGGNLKRAGVVADLNVYEGMSHVQFQDTRITPESRRCTPTSHSSSTGIWRNDDAAEPRKAVAGDPSMNFPTNWSTTSMHQLVKSEIAAAALSRAIVGSTGPVSVPIMPKVSPMVFYRTVKVDGLSIFYREAGRPDAPTLLLLHGFPSSSRMYEPLLTRLSGH